jgi:hypothetical protein
LGDFILRIDGVKRTFGDACAAVDAGFWVNVKPGPFLLGLTRNDTLNGAYGYATTFSDAQAGDNVGHDFSMS